MCSVYKAALILSLASVGAPAAVLRVCADPANLPFSSSHGKGFENEIAALAAQDLGRKLEYLWLPQRGKFFKALEAGACDVAMGVPADFRMARTTQPYYRSSYVFVSRHGSRKAVRSFDDPALRQERIGVQILGVDDAAVPPAQALIRRGLRGNIVWYRLYQTYVTPNAPDVLIQAVAHGDVDVAVAWGPVAGYFARSATPALQIDPVSPGMDAGVPFTFNISMGVCPGEPRLVKELNGFIARRRREIRGILARYGVPQLPASDGSQIRVSSHAE